MPHYRSINATDFDALSQYFELLSEETRSYYAPHSFDMKTVSQICLGQFEGYQAFIATNDHEIQAYMVIKKGFTEGERYRFPQYQIAYDSEEDHLLAPSVADACQSQGLGSQLLAFVESQLKKLDVKRLVLWGGVQQRNHRAVRYYEKNGFIRVGSFHHDGLDNIDMVKIL